MEYIRKHAVYSQGSSSLTIVLTEPFNILGIKEGEEVIVSVDKDNHKIIIEKGR